MSRISIIIPIYNVEKYLKDCLESVINQTYSDIEILLIDDCGSDNSIKIAEDFAQRDKRIRIIRHDRNRGLGPARNTGIDLCSGEYIFFLDSDDYILPNTIKLLLENIIETSSDVSTCKAYAFADNENDSEQKKKALRMNEWLERDSESIYKVEIDNFMEVFDAIPCVAWNKLYSSKFLKENKLYFIDSNKMHEDNGFQLKLFSAGPKISVIDNIGIMYRMRGSSITSLSRNQKQFEHTKLVLEDAFDYIRKYRDIDFAEKFINMVKYSQGFCKFFGVRRYGCEIYWSKLEKKVSIFGMPIFRQRIKKEKLITKFLGITLFKRGLYDTKNY